MSGVLAVMTTRNEAGYIEVALRSILEEGIEVILLDHGSRDGTREKAASFLGNGLLRIEDMPWLGTYDKAQQIRAVDEILARYRHDWYLAVDADEWLRSSQEVTLSELLTREVPLGYSVVNFGEFVFIPPVGVDMWGQDYRKIATRYHFFEPWPRRLMRAWRRTLQVDRVPGAGHTFVGLHHRPCIPTTRRYATMSA